MSNFQTNYSGSQINTAVSNSLEFDKTSIGCIKIVSSEINPVDLNTLIDTNSYSIDYYSNGPSNINVRPIRLDIIKEKIKLYQILYTANEKYTRTSIDGGVNWNIWELSLVGVDNRVSFIASAYKDELSNDIHLSIANCPKKLPENFTITFNTPINFYSGSKIIIDNIPHIPNLYGKNLEFYFMESGDTSKGNINKEGLVSLTTSSDDQFTTARSLSFANTILKSNTNYTLCYDIKEAIGNFYFVYNTIVKNTPFVGDILKMSNSLGINKALVQTLPDLNDKILFIFQLTAETLGNIVSTKFKPMLLEGDYTTTDLPLDYWNGTSGIYDLYNGNNIANNDIFNSNQLVTIDFGLNAYYGSNAEQLGVYTKLEMNEKIIDFSANQYLDESNNFHLKDINVPQLFPDIFSINFFANDNYIKGKKIILDDTIHISNLLYNKIESFTTENGISNIDNNKLITLSSDSISKYCTIRSTINALDILTADTDYTMLINVESITDDCKLYVSKTGTQSPFKQDYAFVNNVGFHKIAIKTKSGLTDLKMFLFQLSAPSTDSSGTAKFKAVLLLGDYTNINIPFKYWNNISGEYDLTTLNNPAESDVFIKNQVVDITFNDLSAECGLLAHQVGAYNKSEVDALLNKKSDCNGSLEHNVSILTWADSQSRNITCEAVTTVTDVPYGGYWMIKLFIYPSGNWKELRITNIIDRSEYINTKNNTENWAGWLRQDNATFLDLSNGNAEIIPPGADLNNYTKVGTYVCQYDSNATQLNCPRQGIAYKLVVEASVEQIVNSIAYIRQEIKFYNYPVPFSRVMINSTWQSWVCENNGGDAATFAGASKEYYAKQLHTAYYPFLAYKYMDITTYGNGIAIILDALDNIFNSEMMISFIINIYAQYKNYRIKVSGYMYSTTNNWYEPSAVLIQGDDKILVKMGRTPNNKAYIALFPANTGFMYSSIVVSEFQVGYKTIIDCTNIFNIVDCTPSWPVNVVFNQTLYNFKQWFGPEASRGTESNTIYFCY